MRFSRVLLSGPPARGPHARGAGPCGPEWAPQVRLDRPGTAVGKWELGVGSWGGWGEWGEGVGWGEGANTISLLIPSLAPSLQQATSTPLRSLAPQSPPSPLND